jgi:hypothetical protein
MLTRELLGYKHTWESRRIFSCDSRIHCLHGNIEFDSVFGSISSI